MSTIGNSPDYQLGYRYGFNEGFREGYRSALVQMRDLMYQAINCIPNYYTIVADSKTMEELIVLKPWSKQLTT